MQVSTKFPSICSLSTSFQAMLLYCFPSAFSIRFGFGLVELIGRHLHLAPCYLLLATCYLLLHLANAWLKACSYEEVIHAGESFLSLYPRRKCYWEYVPIELHVLQFVVTSLAADLFRGLRLNCMHRRCLSYNPTPTVCK